MKTQCMSTKSSKAESVTNKGQEIISNTCEARVTADQRAHQALIHMALCLLPLRANKNHMYPHEREQLDQLCDVWLIIDENKQVNTEQQAEDRGEKR